MLKLFVDVCDKTATISFDNRSHAHSNEGNQHLNRIGNRNFIFY